MIAGIESSAKIKSVFSTNKSTTNKGVHAHLLLTLTQNLLPSSLGVILKNLLKKVIIEFF